VLSLDTLWSLTPNRSMNMHLTNQSFWIYTITCWHCFI